MSRTPRMMGVDGLMVTLISVSSSLLTVTKRKLFCLQDLSLETLSPTTSRPFCHHDNTKLTIPLHPCSQMYKIYHGACQILDIWCKRPFNYSSIWPPCWIVSWEIHIKGGELESRWRCTSQQRNQGISCSLPLSYYFEANWFISHY